MGPGRINCVLFSRQTELTLNSVVLDTACSSALYALHMACNDLSSENCSAAIVAGVNLIQSPEQYISIAQAGLLSPTGASHSFDASADGYARGEAVSALLLKPLNQALKHGDPVRAIVRGTAVNRYYQMLSHDSPEAHIRQQR